MSDFAFIKRILAFTAIIIFGVSVWAQSAPKCDTALFEKTSSISAPQEAISDAKIANVLTETIETQGNYTSRYVVNGAEAMEIGQRWLGDAYTQIGKANSGVFVSADGKRRFRIDGNSLMGTHSPYKPHIHLELVNPVTTVVISNNHILLAE
ncbi:MAG: hypothetical protein J7501_06950 [Bdellovibrio sp.]|nr:hypothetical protein [Bdellovibrio sp.]